MKTQRLDQLADGIFAIIMTLLAFEMKVPIVSGAVSDLSLWHALIETSSIFLTFILSFTLLFTYWRAHHFIVSVYAQNFTAGLANYNALFFFLIALIPFSSKFMGDYSNARVPIIVYGANVVFIGLVLYFMRRYIERNPGIDTMPVHRDELISGYVRILFPVFSALIAIIISLWSPSASVLLFTIAILFNLIPSTTRWIHKHIVDSGRVDTTPFEKK